MRVQLGTGISGIDTDARVVIYTAGALTHVPVSGLLSAANTASAVDELNSVTTNSTASIPAGWAIDNIFFVNTTANAVTGGVKIGTSSGATDVLETIAVGANAIVDCLQSLDWHLNKRLFSTSAAQTLYIQAVTSWNSASLNIRIKRTKLF